MITKVMGFVVRTIDYKDSSLLVYLLTHEYGLIGLIAKGAKQMKSKLRSGTSKFTYGYFYIYYKEDNLSILKEVDVIDNYPRLHEDITLIGYLNYVTDLTTQVYKESNETKLLDYLLVTLNKMNQGLDAAILTNILEVKYLPLLGVSLNLDSCVKCKSTTNLLTLSLDNGGMICQNCYTNEILYSKKTLYYLRLFMNIDISKITKIDIKDDIKKELDNFLTAYYSSYTGLYLKSKKFLQEIKGF